MKSRKHFVKQVATTIATSHEKADNESFIFGISGKWGEGKTTFLRQLEDELNNKNFKVVWFNPWKYAKSAATLHRKFIELINSELPEEQQLDLADFDLPFFGQ
jgi:predicted KAP-like P-loop ATPase